MFHKSLTYTNKAEILENKVDEINLVGFSCLKDGMSALELKENFESPAQKALRQ